MLEDCCKAGKGGHAWNAIPTANTKIYTQKFTNNSSVFSSVENRGKQKFQLLMVQFAQSGLKTYIFSLLKFQVLFLFFF